ncbi:hypothetical protein [Mesorhizobium sp. M1396]|uniref:hypothetical protein n=1 Tax=Mesorhizobium sp. M1396 TaxID=2957095 RepID=UPI00333D2259
MGYPRRKARRGALLTLVCGMSTLCERRQRQPRLDCHEGRLPLDAYVRNIEIAPNAEFRLFGLDVAESSLGMILSLHRQFRQLFSASRFRSKLKFLSALRCRQIHVFDVTETFIIRVANGSNAHNARTRFAGRRGWQCSMVIFGFECLTA